MGKLGCTINGNLDESKFDQPIPWIGLYAAAASALCALAMAADAFHGIRNRKFWFPCKFFSLNAATLTLLAVATKLSVDLNTGMPRRQDQLAKLSSAVLICTAMGNFFPSLGSMDNKELLANMLALGIFVITVIANICIQLVTGVIYMFCREHVLVMFLMLVLLVILVSSALTIPTTKHYFDRKYRKKYEVAMRECSYTAITCKNKKLRNDLTRFWMMAHTCSPQFVMARLATCTASGAICVLSIVVLAEAMLWSHLKPRSFRFCQGESAYKWSSTLILAAQIVAIVIGSIAPAFRWFNVIKLRFPKKLAIEAWKPDFKVEKYWTRRLSQWREYPLALGISDRFFRKLVHSIKDKILCFCIWLQVGIVLLSKLIRLISIYSVSWLVMLAQHCKKLMRQLKCKISNSVHATDQSLSMHNRDPDLKDYVLHLEGEEDLIDVMVKRNFDATSEWIKMGRKKQPKHLLRLISEIDPSREFKGVWDFDSKQSVPSVDGEFGDPPNTWALPVVTLTSIAIAVCNSDPNLVKEVVRSVKEGLSLIRIVEENLDEEGVLENMRKAADMVWLGVDLNYKWLDVDLRKLALQASRSPEALLQRLAAIAEGKVAEFLREDTNGDLRETPSKWPIKVLAANSMYRICKTLLLNLDSSSRDNSETAFKSLSIMITDIMGACLMNLRRVLSKQCQRRTIKEREESVRSAIVLLGKSKELLSILDGYPLPLSLDPDLLADIDQWRTVMGLC